MLAGEERVLPEIDVLRDPVVQAEYVVRRGKERQLSLPLATWKHAAPLGSSHAPKKGLVSLASGARSSTTFGARAAADLRAVGQEVEPPVACGDDGREDERAAEGAGQRQSGADNVHLPLDQRQMVCRGVPLRYLSVNVVDGGAQLGGGQWETR